MPELAGHLLRHRAVARRQFDMPVQNLGERLAGAEEGRRQIGRRPPQQLPVQVALGVGQRKLGQHRVALTQRRPFQDDDLAARRQAEVGEVGVEVDVTEHRSQVVIAHLLVAFRQIPLFHRRELLAGDARLDGEDAFGGGFRVLRRTAGDDQVGGHLSDVAVADLLHLRLQVVVDAQRQVAVADIDRVALAVDGVGADGGTEHDRVVGGDGQPGERIGQRFPAIDRSDAVEVRLEWRHTKFGQPLLIHAGAIKVADLLRRTALAAVAPARSASSSSVPI